jgi:GGDEF domain-containing protein
VIRRKGDKQFPKNGGNDCATPAIGEIAARFSQWFESGPDAEQLWPAFDRWVRDSLNQFVGARRVRCFRVTESDQQLVSLTSDVEDAFLAHVPPQGLFDHVVASGRRYVAGAPGNGELIERLAAEWTPAASAAVGLTRPPDWLVPIRCRNRTIGLIMAGELPPDRGQDVSLLQAVGHLLELFWLHIRQAGELSLARQTDPGSGVLTRADLAARTDSVLREATVDGEPLVLLAIAVEGVRRLDDRGDWRLRDWMMKQIGIHMRRKLRSDDLVGRFSDERFVAVLRRIDVSLGRLIAQKILETLTATVASQPPLAGAVRLRCGVAGASGENADKCLVDSLAVLEEARHRNAEVLVVDNGEYRAYGARAAAEVSVHAAADGEHTE